MPRTHRFNSQFDRIWPQLEEHVQQGDVDYLTLARKENGTESQIGRAQMDPNWFFQRNFATCPPETPSDLQEAAKAWCEQLAGGDVADGAATLRLRALAPNGERTVASWTFMCTRLITPEEAESTSIDAVDVVAATPALRAAGSVNKEAQNLLLAAAHNAQALMMEAVEVYRDVLDRTLEANAADRERTHELLREAQKVAIEANRDRDAARARAAELESDQAVELARIEKRGETVKAVGSEIMSVGVPVVAAKLGIKPEELLRMSKLGELPDGTLDALLDPRVQGHLKNPKVKELLANPEQLAETLGFLTQHAGASAPAPAPDSSEVVP